MGSSQAGGSSCPCCCGKRIHTDGKVFQGVQHQELFLSLVIAPWRKAVHGILFFPLLPSSQIISGTDC